MSGRFAALLLISTVPLYVFALAGVQVSPTTRDASNGTVTGSGAGMSGAVERLTPGLSVIPESPEYWTSLTTRL
jgi:hypothetical protein